MKIESQHSIGDMVFVVIDSTDMPYFKKDKIIAFEVWLKGTTETLFIRTLGGFFDKSHVFLDAAEAEKAVQKLKK